MIGKTARLVKLATDDGLFEVEDHVPLGREYEIISWPPREAAFYHVEKKEHHTKDIIYVRSVTGMGDYRDVGYFPIALLEIVEDASPTQW